MSLFHSQCLAWDQAAAGGLPACLPALYFFAKVVGLWRTFFLSGKSDRGIGDFISSQPGGIGLKFQLLGRLKQEDFKFKSCLDSRVISR